MGDSSGTLRRRGWALSLAAVVLAPSLSAFAQADLERFSRQLEQIRRETRLLIDPDIPVEQRATIDYGAYLSFFFLAADDTEQNTHILREVDLYPYARVNIDGVHQFFIRGRVGYEDFNSGDSFDGEGDDTIGPELERAYYQFDYARMREAYDGVSPEFNIQVLAGRQLMHWGNGLTLSTELDGGQVAYVFGPVRLEAFGGRTYEEQVDFDSSRPGFDDNMKRDFFGGRMIVDVLPQHRVYMYGITQDDENDDDIFFGRSFRYDSYYIGLGAEGAATDNLLYGVELVFEGGEGLSDLRPIQTEEDISAWAFDTRLDYLLNDAANTRLSAELLLASGDDDRLHTTNTVFGNEPGTKDNAFNAFGLVNTGLAFSPNVSNLFMVRVGASTYPLHATEMFRRLQVGVDLFVFNKLDTNAPIDELTSDDRYLGIETDFFANWQVTSDLALSLRYGVFFPGEAIETDNDARHFLFTGVTVGF